MFFKLLLLFTIVPFIELYILLELSHVISTLPTFALVIITGIAGAYLAKSEGRLIITKIKQDLNFGRIPGDELLNGLCVLIGGALLITPGIITDIFGFSLVIPGFREIYKVFIKRKFKNMITKGNIHFY